MNHYDNEVRDVIIDYPYLKLCYVIEIFTLILSIDGTKRLTLFHIYIFLSRDKMALYFYLGKYFPYHI